MEHRGEDASRRQADRGGKPPWEDERYAGQGLPEYGQHDDYGPADGYAGPAGHGPAGGYEPPPGPGYDQRYGPDGGYQDGGYQNGGYQDGYQGQDAGNDWYGGQPATASGTSFADTGAYSLSGRIADEYGTGPSPALRDPARGYPPSSDPSAPGYPDQASPQGRPFPAPAPPAASGPMTAPPRTGPQSFSRTGPQAAPRTGPQMVPHTGQQERYDGYDPRTGPARGDYDDYAAQRGYDGASGYGEPAGGQRDRHDNYAPGVPYGDQDGRRDGSRDGRGGRNGNAAAPRTGSTGQPRLGRPGGRRSLLLAAIAVVAVIVIGVAAYLFLFKPTSTAGTPATAGPLPPSGTAPSSQACVKKYGTYCHISMSSDDPAPLTISELFPPAFTNDADKKSFSLVSTKLDKTCSKAVIGQNLISALKTGKCTQVVRASYVSGTGKIMGTIGVVNLATTNGAHYAGKVVGQSDFIAPLAAAKGVAKKLGQGTGVVEAEFKGHYLILTWSEFTTGSTPSTKTQDSELEQFSSDLVAGTANISLSQRMVTGTAPTPAAS